MFSIKQSWIAWLLAAIIVWIWEFLLHYSPNVLELWAPFEFLSAVPNERFAIGHIFVLIWIPLYFVGYYHFYLMLKGSWEKVARLFFFLAIASFLYWGIWIATRWYIGTIVQLQTSISPEIYTILTEKYLFYFDSLLWVLRKLLIPISILWIFLILKWKTRYPKWMAIFSPMSLNIAHFVLFSISLYFVYKH